MMRWAPPALAGLALLGSIAALAAEQPRLAAGTTLADRYRRAESQLTEARNKAAAAAADRERATAEESALQQNLVTNAAKLQQLEQMAAGTAAELDRLNRQIADAGAALTRDRGGLIEALAILQRIGAAQKSGAFGRPDEALRATRAILQAGGAVEPLYRDSANLSGQLKTLASLQAGAAARQAEAAREEAALNDTRGDLDRLMAQKHAEQASLAAKSDDLQKVVDDIGREAGGLKALMDRIASLRAMPAENLPKLKTVGPGSAAPATLARGALHPPVAGKAIPGDPAGPGVTPGASGPTGLWYQGAGRGEAVAPGDAEVVFAGPYQKLGQVLILELAGGYDLALAGLGRIDVRVGDLVLAGEPVGMLPEGKPASLYMELRRNGKVVDPAPWVSANIGKAKGT